MREGAPGGSAVAGNPGPVRLRLVFAPCPRRPAGRSAPARVSCCDAQLPAASERHDRGGRPVRLRRPAAHESGRAARTRGGRQPVAGAVGGRGAAVSLPRCRRRGTASPGWRAAPRARVDLACVRGRGRGMGRLSPADPVAIAVQVAGVLERLGVRYVLGGSLASAAFGEPRATLDVDRPRISARHRSPRTSPPSATNSPSMPIGSPRKSAAAARSNSCTVRR